MIATGMMGNVAPGTATTGAAAAFSPYDLDAMNSIGEPNVSMDTTAGAAEPAIFGPAERPVAGFRGILWTLTRNGIPRLPLGPSKVARMGPGMTPAGKAPQGINKVQQFQPVQGPAAAGEWYEYLR